MTVETGLSDHHKLTISILKIFFKNKKPVKITYRSYKYFNELIFRNELINSLQNCDHDTLQYDEFKNIFLQVLNAHVPIKQRIVRGNNQPLMNKTLSKAFMYKSKLKNQYNKNPIDLNKVKYKRQRNCVNLLGKEKKKFYSNLELKIFDDNNKFWQNIKPLFSNKQNVLQKNISIIENTLPLKTVRWLEN